MADEQGKAPEPAIQPAPQPTPVPATPPVSAKEMEEGKVFAILSYIIPFFLLVPLIQRNNAFSLYHAKQCLLLWLASFVIMTALSIIVCVGWIVMPFAGLAILILAIMGLINAIKGEMKPVPLVGKFAEEWFKGLTKQA